nr:hypothetical protein [Nitrosomonas nitrosa]
MQEQFEQGIPVMIKAVLDFLQMHRELILKHASVVIEDMLVECPEALDSVDMVLRTSIHEAFGVVDGVALVITFD